MQAVTHGLHEGALTLAYNAILYARSLSRRLLRPTTVGVRVLAVHPDHQRVLLVRHRGGARAWSLPGGGVDRRETLEHAAQRELREEAGCDAQAFGLLGIYFAYGDGMSNHIAVFHCVPHGPARPPRGDLEIVDARFFPQFDLPANTEYGSLRRIAELAAGLNGLYGEW
jgi:8-oxo-dGTP diphosphatase